MRMLRFFVVAACLVVAVQLIAQMTPASVQLVSASTGPNVILLILTTVESHGEPTVYTIACDLDVKSCVIPDKSVVYTLRESSRPIYKCGTNVGLYQNEKELGPYCLQGLK